MGPSDFIEYTHTQTLVIDVIGKSMSLSRTSEKELWKLRKYFIYL